MISASHSVHDEQELDLRRRGVEVAPRTGDEQLLADYEPPLSRAELDAAWRYAAAHQTEIAQAIQVPTIPTAPPSHSEFMQPFPLTST